LKKIGVLALQGAVSEHTEILERCGVIPIEIKKPGQIDDIDGLIIPGGESSTIGNLMNEYSFFEKIREFASKGKPIYGTCAGLILMSKNIIGENKKTISIIDIEVRRNAFGRQIDSMEIDIEIPKLGNKKFPAVFIRAPIIEKIGKQVEILAEIDDRIVMAQQKNLLVSAFHPELSNDDRVHRYFLNLVNKRWRQ